MTSGSRSDDLANEIWGTWEELLLASAVNRHGTRSWDSVAMEIQARSPFSDLLTPQSCHRRYLDLKRRFESGGENFEEDADVAGEGGDTGSPVDVPWLEDLRNLRMAELRREVERYDVSITSLQLKLKNLRAERERSEAEERGSDLKDKEMNKDEESPEPGPDGFAIDINSVGNSAGSCKESNSTDPKEQDRNPNDGGVGTMPEKSPEAGNKDAVPRHKRESSYNGSSETLSKAPEGAPLLLGESGESVAGEAVVEKESSDVQSSASLSRRRRRKRRKAISGSSSVAEEAETDSVSPFAVSIKPNATAESQPLAAFLEIIRASKHGSFFVRRLENQENARYRSVIRRYVDLEILRSRLERRGAKYSSAEFFRDLLLLCVNAIVFFPKGSPESLAAVNLRQMVSKEMADILPKRANTAAEDAAKEPQLPLLKVVANINLDADLNNPPPKKNRSGPLIACRKRSSISKVQPTSDAEAPKDERDNDSDSGHREREDEVDVEMQSAIAKPKTKERSKVSGARGLRTNKNRGGPGVSALRNSKPASALKPSHIDDEVVNFPLKAGKKDAAPSSNLTPKKKNAASFLNRLKANANSSSITGTLLNSLKSSGDESKGSELKRVGKGEARNEAASPSPESIHPAKRSVGRPPKRTAPTPTPSPPPPKRVKLDATPPKRPPAPPHKKRGRK